MVAELLESPVEEKTAAVQLASPAALVELKMVAEQLGSPAAGQLAALVEELMVAGLLV